MPGVVRISIGGALLADLDAWLLGHGTCNADPEVMPMGRRRNHCAVD